MSIISVTKDLDALTMTVTAEYDVTAERAWQLWADTRQLERWWGPPTYPATVKTHELRPGGEVTYVMTGPEGDSHGGWWDILEVEAPRALRLNDGFAKPDGSRNTEMPTTVMAVEIVDREGGGVVMTMTSQFPSLEALQAMLEMGMEEGLSAAMGQIDAILAESSH